jgi:hypothetical protein
MTCTFADCGKETLKDPHAFAIDLPAHLDIEGFQI